MTENERSRAASVLKALAHPLRLGILEVLAESESTVSGLVSELGCSQSMMSQQLRILETQGLVLSRRVGTMKYCRIGNQDMLKLFGCLSNHLSLIAERAQEYAG